MLLNKRNTISLCLLLLILLVISVISKEVIYETVVDGSCNNDDGSASGYCETQGTEVSSITANVYTCIERYNTLLQAYVDSLNDVTEKRENANMDNAFYQMNDDRLDAIDTADVTIAQACPVDYSIPDQYHFVNVAYDQHYLNWLNINILRSFGSRGCNVCSPLLGGNLNNDESMDLIDGKAPRLWSLHHIGFYDASQTDLLNTAIFDEYDIPNCNGIKQFYTDLERDTYSQTGYPVKIYFGVKKVGNAYKAYVAKDRGLVGLNKLTQGCAIPYIRPNQTIISENGGTINVTASTLQAPNVYMTQEAAPGNIEDQFMKADYIDPNYFTTITSCDYAGNEETLSVFGFFNV